MPAGAQAPAAAGLERMVQEVRAEMMKPGPAVRDWNVGGADPDAALDTAGADAHLFLIEEGEERHVEIRTDRRISEFAPPQWQAIDSYGSPVTYAERPFVGFSALGTGYAVGIRSHRWRENGLDCEKGASHAIFYRVPGAATGNPDENAMIGLFRISMLAMEGQTICTRSKADPEGGWRSRMLRPDGRDLPALNKIESRVRIVPMAPVSELVKGVPFPEATDRSAE